MYNTLGDVGDPHAQLHHFGVGVGANHTHLASPEVGATRSWTSESLLEQGRVLAVGSGFGKPWELKKRGQDWVRLGHSGISVYLGPLQLTKIMSGTGSTIRVLFPLESFEASIYHPSSMLPWKNLPVGTRSSFSHDIEASLPNRSRGIE